MLNNLIDLFKDITAKIEAAIEDDNVTAIGELDKSLDRAWNDLLSYNPENAEETRMLIEFLIDQLFSDVGVVGINKRIKEKLMNLH